MKHLGIYLTMLALCVVVQPCIAFTTGVGTITLMPGVNWVAVPVVPFDCRPESVFNGIDIHNNLTRWDSFQQKTVVYDAAHPEALPGILVGEGYTITNHGLSSVTLSYSGVIIDDTDIWISLERASGPVGANWIGITYTQDVLFDRVIVTDGSESGSIAQAVQWGWLDSIWTTMNSATQTTETVGAVGQQGVDTNYLRSGHMYKLQTYRSNLALIVQHPVPEPSSLVALGLGLLPLSAAFARRRRRPI